MTCKNKHFKITFEKVHFRTMKLTYSDSIGTAIVYFEESSFPNYDWIGDESSFNLPNKRLSLVLDNIQKWAEENTIVLKIWRKEELGM